MYMRVFTVQFEQFLCLLTGDFKCHTVPSAPLVGMGLEVF